MGRDAGRWSARLGSLRAWPHGYHARSPQESPPGDRGRHRRRRHASRSVPRTGVRSAATRRPTYGWPVKPFHKQHPVRGFFGDPRIGMTPKGMRSSFHFGIDISCPNGTAVYATLDGVVRLESFRPETVAVIGRDGHTEFQYWHIKPAVRNGQRVKAYVTVVGWAEPPWEHVHFSERRDGVYVNPLRPGALGPFSDTTTPWVKQLRAEVGGRPVSMARGAVDLVVEAYDETPIRVPGRWGGKPVTPALLRWRVTTAAGRVVRPWRSAIDHRLTIPRTISTRRSTAAGRARTRRTGRAASASSSNPAGTAAPSPTGATWSRSQRLT